jgi:hypothetical protein
MEEKAVFQIIEAVFNQMGLGPKKTLSGSEIAAHFTPDSKRISKHYQFKKACFVTSFKGKGCHTWTEINFFHSLVHLI